MCWSSTPMCRPRTWPEFVAYVKRNPGKAQLRLGRAGLAHAPDHGAVQAARSPSWCTSPTAALHRPSTTCWAGRRRPCSPAWPRPLPHIRSGRMRPLAVTGKQRSPQYKDVPTLDEAGFKGFDAQQWYGVVGPAGMPADVVKQLNDTLAATCSRRPTWREKLAGEAIEPWPMTPEQFGQYIKLRHGALDRAGPRPQHPARRMSRSSRSHIPTQDPFRGTQHPGPRRPQRPARHRHPGPLCGQPCLARLERRGGP
jgi:tripartite-type tricarboxylate transporter receptor subunit TctC